jgi:predicted secreted protein
MLARRIPTLCLLPLLVIACSTGGSFQSDRVLTAADAGMVMMENDDQFSVKLESNPASGLAWHVLISNEAILIRQGEPVLADGIETFTYRVAGSGESQLVFEYKRSNDDTAPAKVLEYTVIVD